MKKSALAILLLASGVAIAESRILVGLTDFDERSLVCGCTLHESVEGVAEGRYGSGSLLFAIAPNADPPYALVNRGAGNVKLLPMQQIEFPLYQCEAGEQYISEWTARNLVLRSTLEVVSPGEEACWFRGEIAVHDGVDQAVIPVKGACGC